MTIEEAQKVARIALTADGGCSVCVNSLLDQLFEAFPESTVVFNEVLVAERGYEFKPIYEPSPE